MSPSEPAALYEVCDHIAVVWSQEEWNVNRADAKQGPRAFAEKRRPHWSGS